MTASLKRSGDVTIELSRRGCRIKIGSSELQTDPFRVFAAQSENR